MTKQSLQIAYLTIHSLFVSNLTGKMSMIDYFMMSANNTSIPDLPYVNFYDISLAFNDVRFVS